MTRRTRKSSSNFDWFEDLEGRRFPQEIFKFLRRGSVSSYSETPFTVREVEERDAFFPSLTLPCGRIQES
ncbi:MAG: hypothetical protein LUQ71_05180 [Methanoregula sp.]|nr:hypothetical protein [Methanoregula sp.]